VHAVKLPSALPYGALNRRTGRAIEATLKSQRHPTFLALFSRQISTVEVKVSDCERQEDEGSRA
jgi:hypothetical protein